jgi:hypothetical protein
VHEANKQRAGEHCDSAVALADFAIQTLKDHVAGAIAALDAASDGHAWRCPPAARMQAPTPRLAHGPRRQVSKPISNQSITRIFLFRSCGEFFLCLFRWADDGQYSIGIPSDRGLPLSFVAYAPFLVNVG